MKNSPREEKLSSFVVKKYSCLEFFMNNNNVLIIPHYSMCEKDTNLYNLWADSHINMVLSKISQTENAQFTITVPKIRRIKNFDRVLEMCTRIKKTPIRWKHCECYLDNVGETRNNIHWYEWINEEILSNNYDLLVFMPNVIGTLDIPSIKKVYWNTVCQSITLSNMWLNRYVEQDKLISKRTFMVVSTILQQKLHKTAFIDNDVYNYEVVYGYKPIKNYEIENFIYLPFRLSDESYKVEFFLYELIKVKKETGFDPKILISSPNNTVLPEFYYESLNIEHVDTDRDTVYGLMAKRPIVPYLCNPDENLHTTLFELIEFDCRIIYIKNNTFYNIHRKGEIESLDDLNGFLKNIERNFS